MSQPHVLLVGGTKMVERHLRKALPEGGKLKVMRTMEQAMRKMAEGPTDLLVLGPSMRRALAMVTTIRRDGDLSLGLIVVYRDDQRENVKRHLEGRHTADAYVMQSKVSKEIVPALTKALAAEHANMDTSIDELHEIDELEELPLEAVSNVTSDVSQDAREVATVQMDVVGSEDPIEPLDEDATQVMDVIHGLNADALEEAGEEAGEGEVLGAFDLDDDVLVDELEEIDDLEELEEIEEIEEVDEIEEIEEIEPFEEGTDTDVVELEPELMSSEIEMVDDEEFAPADEVTVQTELVAEGEADDLEELDAELLEELEVEEELDGDLPTTLLVESLDDAVLELDEVSDDGVIEGELVDGEPSSEELEVELLDDALIEELLPEADLTEQDAVEAAPVSPVAAEPVVEAAEPASAEPDVVAIIADIDDRRRRVRKQSSIEAISDNLNELSSLLGGMQQATAEAARLERDNISLRDQVEALEARLAAVDGAAISGDQLDAAHTAREAAETALVTSREAVAALRAELDGARAEIGALQGQVQATAEAKAQAEATAAEVAEALSGLATRLLG